MYSAMQDMVLKVPSNSLRPGFYNFTLEVWRPGAADAGFGSWFLEVLEAEVPTAPLKRTSLNALKMNCLMI